MSDTTPELKEELTKAEEMTAKETKEAAEKTASGENKKAPEIGCLIFRCNYCSTA